MVERVETERLVLRPWREDDVDRLLEAITSSLDHLRAWLPWALHEPETREAKLERIRASLHAFEVGERWTFGLFDRDETRLVGGVGIETLTTGPGTLADAGRARELGYWLRVDCVGRGLATEAVGALTVVCFEEAGLDYLEIQCDPDNGPSAGIPARLGYRHSETQQYGSIRR